MQSCDNILSTVKTTGFKDFLRPLHILALMRKGYHTLALQVVQLQQSLSCAVTRIQHGFMPLQNVKTAQKDLDDLKRLLLLIEKEEVAYARAEPNK